MEKHDIIEAIQQALCSLPEKLSALKVEGKKIILTQCDILPYEVFAAHGVVVCKLPRWVLKAFTSKQNEDYTRASEFCSLADILVVPQKCTVVPQEMVQQLNVYSIPVYEGFAEDAVVSIHAQLFSLMQKLGITAEYPDNELLQNAVKIYEEIRKIMRTVTTMYTALFTLKEMQLICDAAFSLIPSDSVALLRNLFNVAVSSHTESSETTKALLYTDYSDWDMFDSIHGSLFIAEDDSCNGRRQFDISCNTESQSMYYELLYAYSFKSWCPGMRNYNERADLIYKALPNYDITMVLLLESTLASRNAHIGQLFEYCVLQGTNALILNQDNALMRCNEFITALTKRTHYEIHVDVL